MPPGLEITQEPCDPVHGLSPTLARGIREIDMLGALEQLRRSACHVTVVALAEPPVHEDRHLRAGERDPNCLDSPARSDVKIASIPSFERLRPSCCACSRPVADRTPGRQPVALPFSLSSVVEWVSKTSSIGMASTVR